MLFLLSVLAIKYVALDNARKYDIIKMINILYIFLIMNTQKIEQGQKIGKRLAQSEVGKLMQAIGLLLDVAGYVDYKDDIEELFRGLLEDNKSSSADTEITQAKNSVVIEEEKAFRLKVLEGKNNDYFLTWTTNAFEDREKEIFTLKSIQEYVENNIEEENKGTYQFWHMNGSDFADIVWQGVAGKFLVEIGRFRNNDIGNAFKRFFKKYPNEHPVIAKNGWGCSHGFVYKKADREDGIYEWFDKKETTILPLEEAANVYTLMEVL